MIGHKVKSSLLFLNLILALGACSSGKRPDVREVQVSPSPTPVVVVDPTLNCSATLNKNIANAEESLTLTIRASGGRAPYTVPGWISNFSEVGYIYGSNHNTGTSDVVVERTATVVDSAGHTAYCSFAVTIRPVTTTPTPTSTPTPTPTPSSNLTCSLAATQMVARPGVPVTFTLKASGGTGANYTFSKIRPDYNVELDTTVVAPDSVSATHTYTYQGSRTVYAWVTNNAITRSCQLALDVRPLELLYGGATQAQSGQTMRLRLVARGFARQLPKFFEVTSSDPANSEVRIDTLYNSYYGDAVLNVRSLKNVDHNFKVIARAFTSNNESVTREIDVSFTPVGLSCTIQEVDPLIPNSNIGFRVTSSSGEAVKFTEVNAGPDAIIVSGVGSDIARIKFSTRGEKSVRVKAMSTSRNFTCNNNAEISRLIEIRSTLTACSIEINPNPASIGSPVSIRAILTENTGTGPYQINVTTEGNSVEVSPAVELSKIIRFQSIGNWRVDMRVTDLSNNSQVSCSGYHQALANHGLETRVYSIPSSRRPFSLENSGFEGWTESQARFTSNQINVPERDWSLGYPGVVGMKEWFAVSYRGRIMIPTTGYYIFNTISDDGVIVYIDNQAVIKQDFLHAPLNGFSAALYLETGLHDIKVNYYQGPRVRIALQLKWFTPLQPYYEVIPSEVLYAPGTVSPVNPPVAFQGAWYSAIAESCTTLCQSKGLQNTPDADGNLCTSGEKRPRHAVAVRSHYEQGSGVKDAIFYRWGCWSDRNCGAQVGLTGTVSDGAYCYASGQKKDYDATDITAGCFCK